MAISISRLFMTEAVLKITECAFHHTTNKNVMVIFKIYNKLFI